MAEALEVAACNTSLVNELMAEPDEYGEADEVADARRAQTLRTAALAAGGREAGPAAVVDPEGNAITLAPAQAMRAADPERGLATRAQPTAGPR